MRRRAQELFDSRHVSHMHIDLSACIISVLEEEPPDSGSESGINGSASIYHQYEAQTSGGGDWMSIVPTNVLGPWRERWS